MEERTIIKGTPQKNKIAMIIMIAGIVLIFVAVLVVANYVFNNCGEYIYFGYGSSHRYSWDVIYDFSFAEFFFDQFFNIACYYGYMIIVGLVVIIVGIVIKMNTEKCEITVTNEAITGKLPHKKEVSIPMNQITAIIPSAFDGVSVVSIGSVSNFYCFKNRDEVIKVVSYLLSNSQQAVDHRTQTTGNTAARENDEIEQLKRLKEFLDTGVITQAEFDAKKKQILGL